MAGRDDVSAHAVGVWTLAQVAELAVEARATPSACTELVAAVYYQHPVFAYEGVEVLIIGPPHGPSPDRQGIARVVKAMRHAEPCLWLELLGDVERRTEPGEVLREPSPTAARTPALAGGDVLVSEHQRLEAEGQAGLASLLGHYARRWQDYRVPVWRRGG